MVIREELTERRVRLLLLKHPRQLKETEKGSMRGSTHSTLASAPSRSRLVRPGTFPAHRISSYAKATVTGRLYLNDRMFTQHAT